MSRKMGSSPPGAPFTTALTGEVTALGFLPLNFHIYRLGGSSFRKVFMQFIFLKIQLDGVNVSCGVVKSTVIIRLKSRSGKVFQSHKIVSVTLWFLLSHHVSW